jgi:hypothetical protein
MPFLADKPAVLAIRILAGPTGICGVPRLSPRVFDHTGTKRDDTTWNRAVFYSGDDSVSDKPEPNDERTG